MAPACRFEPMSREPSPEDRASAGEEAPSPFLSPDEQEVVQRTLRRMRLFRPHLYKVLRAWIESLEHRAEPSGYSHGAYRGWYVDQAKKLRLSENGVKRRLRAAQSWLAKRTRKELGR